LSNFDFAGVFDDDYLYFYEPILTPERTAEDVDHVVALLGLEPGAEILDCPCGHGRIANALAERGFRVAGLDASELFLERAGADASSRGVDVEYVHGDMRALPWRERFDGLVNWFTSFGYFTDEANRAVLGQFHQALKPGGTLVIETINITRMLRNFQPQHFVSERDGDLMIDRIEFDLENARTLTERTVVRDGRIRKTHFVVRWFSVPEVRDWLHDAGFENVRTPGLALDTRLVVVADRSAS
jgi:2-polyprenyl-3-methyl-5-hydroxy-6-metoxy-1,4-benzoquinol methylase